VAATTARTPSPPQQAVAEKRNLPIGAVKMSRTYLDHRNLPCKSPYPVPVDADERRTAHVLHQCPHKRVVNGGGRERCEDKAWLLPADRPRFCPDHGEKLTPVADDKPPALLAVAAETVQLHGRSVAPWAVPAACLLGDAAMAVADLGAGDVAWVAPALAGVGYTAVRRRLTRQAIQHRRIERGQRDGKRVAAIRAKARRAAWVGAEIGAWGALLAELDLTSTVGVGVAALGMARWAVGAYPWWKRADERRDRGQPAVVVDVAVAAEQQQAPPDPVQLRAVTTWKTLIGCANGPLAGTELVDFKRLPACPVGAASRTRLPNWSAKVVPVVTGSINMRENRPNLLGRIAAAYGCTYADVSFTADESDLGVGWLRVQPDNVLAETRMWSGPGVCDWKRGLSQVGRFDDDQPIIYRWWTKAGAAHDLIGGSSGGGKSEFIAQLLLASLNSDGLVIDWVGDPQGGQSFGALKDKVDWFARDVAEIRLMLLAALKEMLRRNDELSKNNIKTWQPSRAMPLLVITLDEVQAYIDDPIVLELVEKLAGQARKCGIKLRLSTQIIAAYNLGGSTYIKDQVKTGQTIVFRSETDVAGRSAVESDSMIDPTMLPKVWGPNTCAAGETTAGLLFVQGLHGRDVYGRTDFTGEKVDHWLSDNLTPGVFGPEAQAVSGVLWGERKQRAALLLAAGRSDADLLSKGAAVELIEAAKTATQTGEPVRATPVVDSGASPASRDLVLAAAKACAGPDRRARREEIAAGVAGQMADGTFAKALTDLVAAGKLIRVKSGKNSLYEVPA
jgi:hypothetical protein